MITFVATIHILACLILIVLVLMQDSKGGGVFTSQSTSNSLLGATGATTLAVTATQFVSLILAITCIALAMSSSRSQKSVVDSITYPVGATTTSSTATTTSSTATTAAASTEVASATTTAPAAVSAPQK